MKTGVEKFFYLCFLTGKKSCIFPLQVGMVCFVFFGTHAYMYIHAYNVQHTIPRFNVIQRIVDIAHYNLELCTKFCYAFPICYLLPLWTSYSYCDTSGWLHFIHLPEKNTQVSIWVASIWIHEPSRGVEVDVKNGSWKSMIFNKTHSLILLVFHPM